MNIKKINYYLVINLLIFTLFGCTCSDYSEDENFVPSKLKVPTLIVIMNWNNYSENDPSVWNTKFFDKSSKSVNRWYYYSTEANVELVPVEENSGVVNDGVITIDMNKNHPGGYSDTTFRDEEITKAITSKEVDENINFAKFDTNGDGNISYDELQIVFIVAGGEESYGDSIKKSVWAHAWNYEESPNPKLDGVDLMKYTGDFKTSGVYVKFGALHDVDSLNEHKATVGIMAHEMAHSLFDLYDLYDLSGGSGVGAYDIMSNGTWTKSATDKYYGETPTEFSAFSRIDARLDVNISKVSTSSELTIQCSSNNLIKLLTKKSNEYFLLECRDTSKSYSDIAFDEIDNQFTTNKLFGVLYHVDEEKENNYESGTQTEFHHYKVALVEKNTYIKMTSTEDIEADYNDIYTVGDVIDDSNTSLYDGSKSGYSIEVTQDNYTNRTMTFKIIK